MSSLSRDPEALLRRLEWTVIRRLDGLLHGDYRTLFRGFGLDLADLREYQFNDDVRRIDWNVTARMQTPYVREYHEDREISAWFLVDLSGSIGFGSGAQTKHTLTVDFVAVMARLLSGHGNAVGAMCYGQRVDQVIAARTGRRHVLHLLQQLEARGQPLAASRQGSGSPRPRSTGTATDLGELLRAAAQLIKRRGIFDRREFTRVTPLAHRQDGPAKHLAGPSLRQRTDKINLRRTRNGAKLSINCGHHFGAQTGAIFSCQLGTVFEYRYSDSGLPLERICDTNHCAFGHSFVARDGLFNLAGTKSMPGHIDHIVGSAQDKGVAIFVDNAPVEGRVDLAPRDCAVVGLQKTCLIAPD
jgi:hypothetical protein